METLKSKLSYWLDDARDIFYDDGMQEKIFTAICTDSEDELLPEDYQLLKKLGKSMMRLSFILENDRDKTKQFIELLNDE